CPGADANSVCAIHNPSCFSRCLRVPIAIGRFYKQCLWIPQMFLLTNPDLHHGLLGTVCRLFSQVGFRREMRLIAFVDPEAFLVTYAAKLPRTRPLARLSSSATGNKFPLPRKMRRSSPAPLSLGLELRKSMKMITLALSPSAKLRQYAGGPVLG